MRTGLLTVVALGVAVPVAAQKKDGLLSADQAIALVTEHQGLVTALRTAMVDDAIVLYPGAPVAIGSTKVEHLLAAQPLLDSLTISWAPVEAWVSDAGDFGVTAGTMTIGRTAQAGSAPRRGGYLAAWRLEGDRWRLAAIMLGALAPPDRTILPPGLLANELPAAAPEGPAGPMVQADLDFAAHAGRFSAPEAFRLYAAPDAVILGGPTPRRGPDAIAVGVAGPADWSWYPVAARAAAAGDLGVTVGQSRIAPRDGGAPSYGKYLTVWRRQPDGTIRFLSDGGSSRPKP